MSDLEEARARVLGVLGILDTPPEERFDRICRLAQAVMGAPATYISLIDRERQWFKSSCGMGSVKETPREGTFCDYAIQRSRPTVVLNAVEDPLFARSPYVQEGPQVRFYTGFPLTVRGQRVGTLCALDFQARDQVSAEQMEQFYDLARMAEAELERNSAPADGAARRQEVTLLQGELRHELDALPSEVVVGVLNFVLERLMEVFERWRGTLETLSSCGFRVLFDFSQAREDRALMAAGCAVDVQRTLRGINLELAQRGLPVVTCGLGLHSGEVVRGRLGWEGHWKDSVVGAPVSLTEEFARLSPDGQIGVSQETALALGEVATFEGELAGPPGLTLYRLVGVGDLFL